MIPTFIAAACKKPYLSQQTYRRHIHTKHQNVKVERIRFLPAISPLVLEMDAGGRNNTRCKICDRDHNTRSTYLDHMLRTHKNGKRDPVPPRRAYKAYVDISAIPTWDDPNNYCRSCKRKYSDKRHYHKHIKRIHTAVVQEAKQLSAASM